MAVIDYTFEALGDGAKVTWETITCGDTGRPFYLNNFNDNTVTVSGAFNSENLTMQGSSTGTDTDVFTLTSSGGANAIFSNTGGKVLVEAPDYIAPSFSGSSGGNVNVVVRLRKS